MQIKTTTRYHLTTVRMVITNKSTNNKCWKGCGEREPSFTVGTTTMENSMEVPRKLYTELPYNPAIPILGIYLDKTFLKEVLHVHCSTFTTAKTWKQPKCPLTDD